MPFSVRRRASRFRSLANFTVSDPAKFKHTRISGWFEQTGELERFGWLEEVALMDQYAEFSLNFPPVFDYNRRWESEAKPAPLAVTQETLAGGERS